MTLVLLDGLEDVTTWTPSASGQVSVVPARYRNGLRLINTADIRYQFLPAFEADTVTVGVAFKVSSLAVSFTVLSLWSDTGATEHVRIVVNTNGSLNLNRATSGLIASAAGVVTVDTWLYLEIQTKLSDTLGFITARVNGVQVAATATNVDTKNAGTKTVFDHLRLAGAATAVDFDDLYLKTGTGDTFAGSVTVETLYPSGNGDVNAWTRHDDVAGANWTAVDEVPASTADYVYAVPAILAEPFNDLTTNGWINASGWTIVAGRTGTAAVQTSASQLLIWAIPAASGTDSLTVGYAVKLDTLTSDRQILNNRTSTPIATTHQIVFVTTTGAIRVQNAATTSYTSAASGLIVANTWAYVECAVKLHDSAGSIVVRVNGVEVLNVSGIDTILGTTTTPKFDQVRLDTNSPAYTVQFDDLYVRNDLVFQGDPVVGGRQDLYLLDDLVHADGTIIGVCHSAYAMRANSTVAQTLKLVNRRAADNRSAALPLSAAWRSLDYCLTVDPETAAAWTIANVNALQSGVEST